MSFGEVKTFNKINYGLKMSVWQQCRLPASHDSVPGNLREREATRHQRATEARSKFLQYPLPLSKFSVEAPGALVSLEQISLPLQPLLWAWDTLIPSYLADQFAYSECKLSPPLHIPAAPHTGDTGVLPVTHFVSPTPAPTPLFAHLCSFH